MYVKCMLGCMHEYVYAYVYVYILVYYMCFIECCSDVDSFVRSEPVTRDLDLIWICACYERDSLAIQRLTHGMIQRFVLVRTVKTRRRFSSKITSFHVSVCSCIISIFIIVSIIYMLLILFYVTIYFILPV